jgi:hypothetical protein
VDVLNVGTRLTRRFALPAGFGGSGGSGSREVDLTFGTTITGREITVTIGGVPILRAT